MARIFDDALWWHMCNELIAVIDPPVPPPPLLLLLLLAGDGHRYQNPTRPVQSSADLNVAPSARLVHRTTSLTRSSPGARPLTLWKTQKFRVVRYLQTGRCTDVQHMDGSAHNTRRFSWFDARQLPAHACDTYSRRRPIARGGIRAFCVVDGPAVPFRSATQFRPPVASSKLERIAKLGISAIFGGEGGSAALRSHRHKKLPQSSLPCAAMVTKRTRTMCASTAPRHASEACVPCAARATSAGNSRIRLGQDGPPSSQWAVQDADMRDAKRQRETWHTITTFAVIHLPPSGPYPP